VSQMAGNPTASALSSPLQEEGEEEVPQMAGSSTAPASSSPLQEEEKREEEVPKMAQPQLEDQTRLLKKQLDDLSNHLGRASSFEKSIIKKMDDMKKIIEDENENIQQEIEVLAVGVIDDVTALNSSSK
jgi:hypothetical protein